PLLALMAGKRKLEEPLAGKSNLNRLELSPSGSPLENRYHKITYSSEALDSLLVEIFLEAHAQAPRQIVHVDAPNRDSLACDLMEPRFDFISVFSRPSDSGRFVGQREVI